MCKKRVQFNVLLWTYYFAWIAVDRKSRYVSIINDILAVFAPDGGRFYWSSIVKYF